MTETATANITRPEDPLLCGAAAAKFVDDCASSRCSSTWSSDDDESTQLSSPLLLGDDDDDDDGSECAAEKEDQFTELPTSLSPSLHLLDASEARRWTAAGTAALQSGDVAQAHAFLNKAMGLYKRLFQRTLLGHHRNGKQQRGNINANVLLSPPPAHPQALEYATTLRQLAVLRRIQATCGNQPQRKASLLLEQARQYLFVALEIVRETTGQQQATAQTLYELGRVCHEQGGRRQSERAQSYYGVALHMYESSEEDVPSSVHVALILHHWGRLMRETATTKSKAIVKARHYQERAWSLLTLMERTGEQSAAANLVEDIERELVQLSNHVAAAAANKSAPPSWLHVAFWMILVIIFCIQLRL